MNDNRANSDRTDISREAPDCESDRAFAEGNEKAAIASVPQSIIALEEAAPQRISALNASLHAKLRRLHMMADEVMTHFNAYSPCRAGCTGCCHYEVKIYPVEASYIARNSDRPLRKEPSGKDTFHGKPCVFLHDERCSIYDVRPLVCRTHLAFTPTAYWCQPERSQLDMPMMALTGLRDALGGIVVQSGETRQLDIRQYFDATGTEAAGA
jgi:Fe-S-cluster containining protein